MGSGARRIHTEFEREVVERLERIEKRLEHAGLHMPCLSDKSPEEWVLAHLPPTESWTEGIFNPSHNVASSSGYRRPKEGGERTVIQWPAGMPDPRTVRPVPDDLESYGYIDDRGEVGMQDFEGDSE